MLGVALMRAGVLFAITVVWMSIAGAGSKRPACSASLGCMLDAISAGLKIRTGDAMCRS